MGRKFFDKKAGFGDIPGLIYISKNTHLYLGFTIRKSPRNALNNRSAYLITKYAENSYNYYGCDFALSEACRTVRRIVKHGRLIPF